MRGVPTAAKAQAALRVFMLRDAWAAHARVVCVQGAEAILTPAHPLERCQSRSREPLGLLCCPLLGLRQQGRAGRLPESSRLQGFSFPRGHSNLARTDTADASVLIATRATSFAQLHIDADISPLLPAQCPWTLWARLI